MIQINLLDAVHAFSARMERMRTRATGCAGCWVHAGTEWTVLSERGLARIDAVRRSVQYRPGESIFHQHEQPHGIYCLQSGLVLLRHLDAFGEQINFQVVKYGETLGWRSFFAQRSHAATAIPLTLCDVCFVPGHVIHECIVQEPELARAFLKTIACDRGPSEALMLRSPQLPTRVRLIHLLFYLKDRCATHTRRQELVYDLPLKRGDIASMIGIRNETLSRAIRDLEDEHLASFDGRRVVVSDPDKLFMEIGVKLSSDHI